MKNSIRDFLDNKHGKFIGRVYMLVLLFIFNACITIGASMYYTFGKTIMVMIIGIIGTVICIGVLSTPAEIKDDQAYLE